MTRALVARKRKIFALFFALAASIGLSWAQNPSGECGNNLTWELDETTGALTISGTGTMLDNPSWKHEELNSLITSVSLPEGLTAIREVIFAECEKLESITLPSGLTYIGTGAFMNCRALREITLPGSLTTLGERAFSNCEQLESITLPEGITTLGNGVFSNCNSLQSVTLPPSLTTLGEGVFRECSRLESITLPDGLTSIGNNAFSGCHYLGSITLPEGVTSIGNNAFEHCGFESIKLPEGITTLETGVFSNCNSLQSVTLPPSLTSIGEWAFSGCEYLASVTLPESVTSIGAYAFFACGGLTSMTLPAGVTTIGEEAFAYCMSLTEFTNKAATPQTINANVFEDATPLSNITLNVPESSITAYQNANVWKDFGTKAAIPAVITKTITDNGMTYDIYDNGVVKVSGTGIAAARIFASNDHDYATSVKRFEFADDCKVYSFGENWYMCYMSYSPLEAADIKTTLPFVAGRNSVFYRKEDGSDESVTVTITAPVIASITKEFVTNYGTPQHIIFNMPVTTFEKGWCNYLSEKDTVTIPTGSLYHLPASYAFKDENTQFSYDHMAADGMEDMFWKYEASGLVEGVDYTRTEEETGVITAENETKVFGKAVVKYQAPQEAPATSWTFWRSDDFKTFPELENGSSHTCKDVTLKIVDGSFDMSGSYITLSTSATNGIQLIAPKGKIFKQVIALDRNLRTSLIWTGEADTVGISSSLMQISLIEFELDAAPAYETVMNLINAIGTVELTAECKAKIDAAREAYDALSDGDKDLVTNIATLTTAEAAFENVMNIWLSGDCDVILWKDTTLTVKKHAGEGNGAMADYNYASRAPWYSGHWYNPQPNDIVIKSVTIEEGVTHLGDYAFAWMSEMKTATIPASVTTIPKDAFYWSKAVDDIYLTVADPSNLTWVLPNTADVQFKPEKGTRCHVPADLLTAYQEKFGTLNVTFVGDLDPITPLTPEQQQALDAAKGLINAIPSPVVYTPACKDAIDAARAAYDALTPDMLKQLVSNYATLTAAEATYESLKDVAVAEAKIAAIPQPVTLKLATRDSIESARAAYEALNADQKLLVSNYDVLTAAEATWAGLINVAPAGALSGKYTINDGGDVIYFAHGNLQYTRENLDADWSTGTFRLAENQYDLIELVKSSPDSYCTDNYGDKTAVGLFGWGTWGEGKTPNLTSSDRTLYTWSTDFSGTLEGTDTWRTLSKDEWVYLLAHNNQSYATVHGVNGLLVAPDGKDIEGKSMTDWVEINDETWTTMQNDGYLFLPACGQRSQLNSSANIITGGQGTEILYYSSTQYSDVYAHNIWYKPGQDPAADDYSNKRQAFGIRLVSAGVNPLDQVQVVKGLIDAIPAEITLDDACVNAIEAARDAYDALDTDAKAILDPADVKKLTDAEATLTALNQAEADEVIAKINNIPTPVELKLATRDSIESARAAYDALNAAQQALVSNYQTLLDAEAALASLNPGVPPATPLDSAQAVKDLIDAIPTPVEFPTSGPAIAAALNAYDALSDAAKGALDAADVQKLTDAAAAYEAARPFAPITTAPAAVAGLKYTGAAQALITAGEVEHGTLYYSLDGENWSEELPTAIPAGAYTVYYKVTATDDYKDVAPQTIAAAIAKADIDFAMPQAVEELAYSAEKQALISAGECADGTFQYKVGENGTWVDTLPKVTDAGTYQVYYKIQGDANHNDYIAEEPLAVSIAKAALTITAENKEVVYGYAAPGFSVSYYGLQGSDLPADVLTGELSYTCSYTVGSNAGEYDITPGGQTSANYDITYVKGKLVVYKADPAFTAPTANTLTYNGGAQTLIAAGITEHGTFEYTFTPNEEESWNTALPQAKNADTYGVYYRVVGDANHLDYEAADAVEVTIAKAALTATADDKSVIYGDDAPEYTVTYEGWQGEDNADVLSGTIAYACEYAQTSIVGDYTIVPSGVSSPDYAITFVNGKVTVSKAVLTITADNKEVTYGDEAPAFTASYEGWKNDDDASVLDEMDYVCAYEQGSAAGTYVITPVAEDINYEITVVPATLTVNKAVVYIKGADIQEAKFEDGNTNAVVLNAGTLEGIQLSDPIAHVTTASFSDATVGEGKTITMFYELTGDAALLANYDLIPTSEISAKEGVIIEKFIPAEEGETEKVDDEAQIKEGIEVYAYGYCDDSGYSLRYHLNSGNPDQYKIDFADSRFTDVDYNDTHIDGPDGTIEINIPVGLLTGDYTMTVTFRNSRFPWLESDPLSVTFHVNLSETYVTPLFDNTIALVDTCNCFTDIQWYHRADDTEAWQPIEGATGHYYRPEGGAELTGEFFVKATWKGIPTYTCGQSDMETLYGADKAQPKATVKAFPNPVVTTTTVTIEYNGSFPEGDKNSTEWNHNIRIVNLMGAEVMNATFEGDKTSVEMSGYPQGNYMISVDGIVVKVMKQ